MPFPEVGKLLQACVLATGCQHFGLLVGQRSATSSLGLVGRLMRNAPTLGDAILDLCTNQIRYIRGSVVYLMVRSDIAYWGYATYIPGIEAVEQITDGALAIGVNMMREFVGASPDSILMSRPVPQDVGAYRRCFGATPQFLAERNALVFPASLLKRPVRGADHELRRILAKSVAEYWAVRKPGVADRVARILHARVILADATLEGVARELLSGTRIGRRRAKPMAGATGGGVMRELCETPEVP